MRRVGTPEPVGAIGVEAEPLLAGVTSLRWGVVIFGLSRALSADLHPGLAGAVATAVLVFHASWRTVRPISLRIGSTGSRGSTGSVPSVVRATGPDLVVALLAAAATGAWTGPYSVAAVPALLAAAYLGGVGAAGVELGITLLALTAAGLVADSPPALTVGAVVATLVAVPAVGLLARRVRQASRLAARGQLSDMRLLNHLLSSTHRIARSSSASLDLDEVVEEACDRVQHALAPSALLVLAHGAGDTGHWRPVLTRGLRRDLGDGDHVADELAQLADEVVRVGGTVLHDTRTLPAGSGAGLAEPLHAEGVVVGAVILLHHDPGRYGAADLAVLRPLVAPIAVAIDNARWLRRLRTVAADEERARLARELHDGVAQLLVGVNLDLGRVPEPAPPEVVRSRAQVEAALAALRDGLVELRARVTETTGLIDLLADALVRIEDRAGVVTKLEVHESGPPLPRRVEHELWRMVQEALVNVERHADAHVVHVRWTRTERAAGFVVEDDGRGFDPHELRRGGGLGMRGLRERADAVGAALEIESTPGVGTRVTARLLRSS